MATWVFTRLNAGRECTCREFASENSKNPKKDNHQQEQDRRKDHPPRRAIIARSRSDPEFAMRAQVGELAHRLVAVGTRQGRR